VAIKRISSVVRVLLTLVVASLIVTWLVSTRLPRAIQSTQNNAALPESPQPTATPDRGAMYIWRDSRGVTHIESHVPPDSVQAEVIRFERRSKDRDTVASGATTTEAAPGVRPENPLSVYTVEGFEALMQQVEEMAQRLEQRNQRVKELSEQL
jgi:hypothetical protein